MASVDIWWNHVAAQLHMNGANAGTTFTDQKGNTVTVGGAVTTTTTSPKFGSACGNFPGGNTDSLSLPNYLDFNFGAGNFTIEGWFKCTNTSRSYMTLIEKDNGAFGAGSWSLVINSGTPTDGRIAFYSADCGSPVFQSPGGTAYNDNVWHHVAVVRNGNQFILFMDGAYSVGGASTAAIAALSVATRIGNSVYASRGWTGTLDEWRITKGHARYTVPFTAPTSEFPDAFDDGHTGADGPPGPMGLPGEDGSDGSSTVSSGAASGGGANLWLPSPPPVYDVNDQSQTRRLIEQALRG